MRIGLTGPLGAGKSTVASVWAELGAGIVEGDAVGHLILENDPTVRKNLILRFGRRIIDSEGKIIKKALAKEAFKTMQTRQDLTQITFPSLYRTALSQIKELESTFDHVVFDAALIYEWGVEQDFSRIVVVTAQDRQILDRSVKSLHITRQEAANRLAGQISADKKIEKADYVIFNEGSLRRLKSNATKTWNMLTEAPRPGIPVRK